MRDLTNGGTVRCGAPPDAYPPGVVPRLATETVTEAATDVTTSTLAEDAVEVTSALVMHCVEQPVSALSAGHRLWRYQPEPALRRPFPREPLGLRALRVMSDLPSVAGGSCRPSGR